MCDGLQGYIQTDNTGFLIQPSGTNSIENNIKSVTDIHTLSIIPEFKQLKVIGQHYFFTLQQMYFTSIRVIKPVLPTCSELHKL